MQNNQGVVGVGVLPFELDITINDQQHNSTLNIFVQQQSKSHSLLSTQSKRDISSKINIPAKRPLPIMNNYYSLMEDEDDENSIGAVPAAAATTNANAAASGTSSSSSSSSSLQQAPNGNANIGANNGSNQGQQATGSSSSNN